MTPINQNCELDHLRTSKINEGVHSGTDGPPCKEYIIHQHNLLPLKREGDLRLPQPRFRRPCGQVITVQRYIQDSPRHFSPLDEREFLLQTFSQKDPSGANADEHHVFQAPIPL